MKTYSTIHTLNNRGNVFLEVMENTLNLNSNQMYTEINLMLEDIKNILSYKGIELSSKDRKPCQRNKLYRAFCV